ncbi:patatin-like protein 6 [Lycium ferocissimum]|uniref:patatin-like protein 6 n=1 Tax=Lycium ferocissimum TaxID=112874 RepID=UPI0028150A84|nr:patatin-like protein 6 [Lycium ferocissimum]
MSAATISTISMMDSNMEVDKLTYEIFSILEKNFLFGYENDPKKLSHACKDNLNFSKKNVTTGKVRILSIDACGSTNGILAAKSLAHLETTLCLKTGNKNTHVADYFDVVAGAGAGGILAGLLFTRGKNEVPLFTANEALKFIVENGRKISRISGNGIFQRVFRSPEKMFDQVFGKLTLKETVKTVLIPCYDLTTGSAFLFSRADALEMDGCDFKLVDVCGATVADHAVEVKSVDGKRKIRAVGGGVVMNNPTAAAITHVLNNKQEFPFVNGVEDLLVVSLGNGESDSGDGNVTSSPAMFVKIAGDGAADMVDQAVSMAFGEFRNSNYVRVQGNEIVGKKQHMTKDEKMRKSVAIAEEMLRQRNVESTLFQGKKLVEQTNLDKLEIFAGELIKEQETRKTSILLPVVLKQSPSAPRTSSATTVSTISSC